MKSYKACLLGAATSVVFLMSGGIAQAQDVQSASYYKADGSRTADYAAAVASWKEDAKFNVDYSKGFLGLEHAYARGLSGQGLIIGVNDSGIHVDHPLFASEGKVIGYDSGVPDYYGNNGLTNPRRPWESHGTHVGGTIAANRNETNPMFGNAYNANILSATANFVAGDFLWYADYIKGIYANTGTDNIIGMANTGLTRIINNSWGSANSIGHNAARETVLANLTSDWGDYWDPIKEHDVLVVWSAGNSSGAHAGYTTTVPITDPSLRGNWLSVANYASSGAAHTSSSLCGQTATWCVAGPGAAIVSGVNDVGMSRDEVLRLFPVADYNAIYTANSVSALQAAASNAWINELNAYLTARNAGGPSFDQETWLTRLAERAVGITSVYGYRYNGPDGYTSNLSSLLYSNRGIFDAAFLDDLYRRADARLQEVFESILIHKGPATAAYTGTSMAAPNISGFAGLLMEYFPEYNTSLISDILVSSSLDLDELGVDLRSGWGAPQMGTALEGPTALRDIREVNVAVGTRDIWTNAIGDARDRYSAAVLQYNQNDIGGLTKVGGGELVLNGNLNYTGDTRVLGGLLTINSIVATSNASVAENGIIGGSGKLSNLIAEAGGVVAPGSSTNRYGTLTVDGDALFEAGSFLWVNSDVNGASYSKLKVNGFTTIEGGNVIIKANTGNWNLRTGGMRILNAVGPNFEPMGGDITTQEARREAILGEFDGVTSDLGFLTGVLSYDSDGVVLTLKRNDVSFASVAETSNGSSVGVVLDEMVLANTNGNLALEDALLDGSVSAVTMALPSLTGETHASLGAVATSDARFIRNAILERGRGETAAVQNIDGKGLHAWASIVGGQTEFDGTADFAAFETDTSGFVAGVDKVGEKGHIGVAIGQTRSKLKKFDLAENTDVNSRNLAVYGGWNKGAISLRAGAAITQSDVEARRGVSVNAFSDRLLSDYEGDSWQAYGEVAWATEYKGTHLTPYASLTHIEYDADFAERGGDAALSGNVSETADLLALGVRSRTVLKTAAAGRPGVTLVGHLAWSENLNSDGVQMKAAFSDGPQFDVAGASLAGDALLVDVSMNFDLTARTTLGVGYSGAHGSDYSDGRIVGRMSFKF